MAASYETIDKVIEVMKRHTDPDSYFKIVSELRLVKGNRSFETTIERMYAAAVKERQKRGPR